MIAARVPVMSKMCCFFPEKEDVFFFYIYVLAKNTVQLQWLEQAWDHEK